jgi:hypothetical protein
MRCKNGSIGRLSVKIKARDGKFQIFHVEILTDSMYSLNIISLGAWLK